MSQSKISHMLGRFFVLISNIQRCADIQPGVLRSDTILHHRGIGVVLPKGVILGKNVNISHNVTFGARSRDGKSMLPTIGDNVFIRASSIIVGDVIIGHDSVVGAGAVVFKDVPPYSLVVEYNKIYVGKYSVNKYKGT